MKSDSSSRLAARDRLIRDNMDLPVMAVSMVLKNSGRRLSYHDRQELEAEVTSRLVECAERWPEYCEKNGYSPTAKDYFRIWSLRRLQGSVIDLWRSASPLTRRESDLSGLALKTTVANAAAHFNATHEEVEAALLTRERLLNVEELPTEIVGHDDTLWDSMHDAITSLPTPALAWVALAFVENMTVMKARHLLGIKVPANGVALQGFVEYTIVSTILREQPQDALDALFGKYPHTVLPEFFETWTPPPALVNYAAGRGKTVRLFLRDAAETFCSDRHYIDEVSDAAVQSRRVRARVASKSEAKRERQSA